MMDIKFRVWDGGRMLYPGDVDCDGETEIYATKWQMFCDLLVGLKERYPLMQYTGLHDKNGKEIYDGDIVSYTYDGGGAYYDEQISKPVEWEEDKCGFSPFCEYDSDCGQYVDMKSVEVIGNVYENPELLKK